MRKLIQIVQENHIQCDNPDCDYKIENQTGEPQDLKDYINVACPLCNSNLLTKEDYETHQKMLKQIDWINKWFSWITIFSSKKSKYEKYGTFHAHEGLKVTKDEEK